MVWWVLPLALVVGILLGSLGGGGAVLTVPVLTTLVGQSPQQATAGSLVIVGLSALVGLVPHLRGGRVRVLEGLTFGVLGVAGALVGSRLSAGVRGPVLMVAFAGLMLAVAAIMVRKRITSPPAGPPAAALPADHADHADHQDAAGPRTGATAGPYGWPVRVVAATGVGLLTGFFGVGGGFLIVPALTVVMGLPMAAAVGTSLLVIAINSAAALATRAAQGLALDWGMVLPFAVVAVFGALLGGRIASRVDQRVLGTAFIFLLVAVALGVATQNVPQLIR